MDSSYLVHPIPRLVAQREDGSVGLSLRFRAAVGSLRDGWWWVGWWVNVGVGCQQVNQHAKLESDGAAPRNVNWNVGMWVTRLKVKFAGFRLDYSTILPVRGRKFTADICSHHWISNVSRYVCCNESFTPTTPYFMWCSYIFTNFPYLKKTTFSHFPSPLNKNTHLLLPPQSSGLSDCLPEAEDMAVKVLKKVSDLATWKRGGFKYLRMWLVSLATCGTTKLHTKLVSNICYFHPYLWEMIQFDSNSSDGLVQPPTRKFAPKKKDAEHNNQPYSAKQVKTTGVSCFGDDIFGRKHKEFFETPDPSK